MRYSDRYFLQVYEAIQMLEDQMIKQDRVRPNEYIFTLLIGIIGRAGYTKKAFQLFKKVNDFILSFFPGLYRYTSYVDEQGSPVF